MLYKAPKTKVKLWSFIKKSVGLIVVGETIACCVAYYYWNRLNTEQDFRKYNKDNFPYILEYYYKFGETIGSNKIRELDNLSWTAEENNTIK